MNGKLATGRGRFIGGDRSLITDSVRPPRFALLAVAVRKAWQPKRVTSFIAEIGGWVGNSKQTIKYSISSKEMIVHEFF